MVEQYKKARLEEGKVPATVNRDFSTLHNMLNKAVEWGHIKYNPLTVVKILDEDNEVMWVLTVDEEAKLLTACEKSNQRNGGKYLKDLVLFALHSAKKRMLILRIDLLLSDIQRLKNHGRFLSMTP
jgi:site-specific recombinase XerD